MSAERKSDPELKNRVAAGIYQAITTRILYHYAAAHSRAKAYGADLSVHYPEPPSILDISERYEELVEEWTSESVSTASSAGFPRSAVHDHDRRDDGTGARRDRPGRSRKRLVPCG